MLRGALTYDSYWDGFVLDQNGGYMYASGDNDALARDPLNHALPLLFYAPQATRGGIRMAVSSTHNKMYSGGRLPKASFGFGLGYQTGKDSATALDRGDWCCYPSDLELWILNAAMRYVLVTRDWGFLAELIETAWGEITMADALWRINHHLFEVESADGGVGLGPHGLLRMLTMDYNGTCNYCMLSFRTAKVCCGLS
jgi:cellobiose phosphorylase